MTFQVKIPKREAWRCQVDKLACFFISGKNHIQLTLGTYASLCSLLLVSLSVHEDVSDILVKERELSSGASILHEAVGEVSKRLADDFSTVRSAVLGSGEYYSLIFAFHLLILKK